MANPAIVETNVDVAQLIAERERLNAEIAQLKAAQLSNKRSTFSVTLSETVQDTDNKGNVLKDAAGNPKTKPGKGGFKVMGLGSRFPVTLYPEQWEVLFAHMAEIKACYNDPINKSKSDLLRK